ncbi:MAG: hypothetical protein L0Y72_31285 [Gemmataceae bacterium]|nr:hypothetical protein [Gemmataceae bacterium]MCI0743535.1 hypothetical protein [Gemmataceae bacterium]
MRDLEGARTTLKWVVDNRDSTVALMGNKFIERVALAEAAAGDLDAAKRTLIAYRGNSEHPYYCDDLLTAALAAIETGNKKDVHAAVAGVAETLSLKHRDKLSDLFKLATTQYAIGLTIDARKTAKVLEDLIDKRGDSGLDRGFVLCGLAALSARLADQAAAKRFLADAVRAARAHLGGDTYQTQQFAVILAETGDVSAALQIALAIPEPGDRDCALGGIALVQLKNGDCTVAEQTAQKIESYQYFNEALLAIAEAYARRGETKKALEAAGTIKNDSRKAQAMLTIAAIVAERGDKQAALTIADNLTYPSWPGRPFMFRDPETWGKMYESTGLFTMLMWRMEKDAAADLTAAAMRCRVAIRGRGDISYSKELEQWDARKAAKAQALGGDAGGALSWVERLAPENRLDGLLGIAEGISAEASQPRRLRPDRTERHPF